MRIDVDSEIKISIQDDGPRPWVFMPDVEWSSFTERTIIDTY
jgi:hypothetical protein